MKKIQTTIIISLLIFGIGTIISTPFVQANPAVMIQNYQLNPEVLMPGDSAVLTLQVVNGEAVATQTSTIVSGGESTTTVRTLGATLEDISILPAQSGVNQIRATTHYQDVGYLAAGTGIQVNFNLRVDANMSEGTYFPTAKIDVSGGTDVQYPLMMKVSNATVTLHQKNVPSKISQGGTTEIVITAVNKRDNTVTDVMVTPQGNDVEFVPSSYFVGSLAAKTSLDVVFSIKPLGTGTSDLTFDVSYKNGDNLHTNSLQIPVSVIQTLDVAPIITNFPISITKGGSSRISIEVYNAKTERITGVLVTPVCDATVIPSQYFIGSMDPDDVFSASFDIYADTVDYGTESIGFIVSFKQGNDYYETPMVSKTFSVVSGPGVYYQSSSGLNSKSSTSNGAFQTPSLMSCVLSVIIVIVVVIIIVVFFIRYRKRRKAT
ncbi:MAG: hypothetical protein JXA75_02485 [Candidatus Thermoplasmatota archaeon]|nr:hypothetical protein [Candidatus Thermoplasmatota archaeon]